jgi:hypothetical protein
MKYLETSSISIEEILSNVSILIESKMKDLEITNYLKETLLEK